MSTKTMSRILLTTIILGAWAIAIYFFVYGYVVYALLLFVPGLLGVLWLWKPWQRYQQHRQQSSHKKEHAKHT